MRGLNDITWERSRIVLILPIILMFAGACTPAPANSQTPTLTPMPASTATPQPTEAPMVDRIQAAVLAHDAEATAALIAFNAVGCTHADGLGGPPKCGEDQEEGAMVDFLPVLGPGEGGYVLPDELGRLLPLPVESFAGTVPISEDLFQDEVFPAGEIGLVFASTEAFTPTIIVYASAAGIVRIDYDMRQPDEVMGSR